MGTSPSIIVSAQDNIHRAEQVAFRIWRRAPTKRNVVPDARLWAYISRDTAGSSSNGHLQITDNFCAGKVPALEKVAPPISHRAPRIRNSIT